MLTAEPRIHVLYTSIGDLLYKVMNCFVEEKVLLENNKVRKEARNLGRVNIENGNLKSIHDMKVGTRARYMVAHIETKQNLDLLKLQFRSCYQTITKYFQSHLPHGFLRDLKCFQPEARLKAGSSAAVRRIALSMAKVLKNSNFTSLSPESYADLIDMEFSIYSTETLELADPDKMRIDHYWNFVGEIKGVDGNLKFKNLSQLAMACLCISHGNAVPERGFSLNKNLLIGRESLSRKLL